MKNFMFFLPLLLVLFLAPAMGSPKSDEAVMTGETKVYEGYLIDSYCGVPAKGMDGSDVANAPWDHTTKCLVMCKGGGYGISVKEGDASAFIPFADDQSNEKAWMLIEKTERTMDNKVSVEGFMVDDKLCVVSIKEIDDFSM